VECGKMRAKVSTSLAAVNPENLNNVDFTNGN